MCYIRKACLVLLKIPRQGNDMKRPMFQKDNRQYNVTDRKGGEVVGYQVSARVQAGNDKGLTLGSGEGESRLCKNLGTWSLVGRDVKEREVHPGS